MNKQFRLILILVVALSLVAFVPQPPAIALPANCTQVGVTLAGNTLWECPPAAATPTPSATASSTATATVAPTATVTPTVGLSLGWHAPGSHDGLNVHEHGDAPPAWVLASANQPFTQVREFHTGYKGTYATDRDGKGVESYLITHILETVAARSHGDHDYQLWVKTPGTGAVSYWAGSLDFGAPPPLRITDTGERPIILSLNDGPCSTWYSRPGSNVFDMGWTICGRYQNFAGVTLGGNGSYRGMDWTLYTSRPQFATADPGLAAFCTPAFGQCRLAFLVTGHQYPAAGVVPIN